MATTLQERWNQNVATDAINQVMGKIQAVTTGVPGDPKQPGLYSLRGNDAIQQGPQIIQQLDESQAQIRAGLQNDQQRLQFDEQTRRYMAFAKSDIGRYLNQQGEEYGRSRRPQFSDPFRARIEPVIRRQNCNAQSRRRRPDAARPTR